MHTLCTLFLGVCTPCADFFWVHAHFFQTLKIPPFSPSCTGSFRIPVSLSGLITSPTSLDRNSKVLFSVVLKGLKSLHSLHGVHEVCTGLPPDEPQQQPVIITQPTQPQSQPTQPQPTQPQPVSQRIKESKLLKDLEKQQKTYSLA